MGVLESKPAKRDHQPRVLDDGRPVRNLADDGRKRADHARQDVLRRAEAVVCDLVDAAAAEEQKSAQKAPRVVNPTGGGPAVGAAENCSAAEGLPHAQKLLGDDRQRLIPGHLAKAVAAAAFFAFAPTFAYRRACDPKRRMHHRRNSRKHVRRRGIAPERLTADNAAVLDKCAVGAPVGKRGKTGVAHLGMVTDNTTVGASNPSVSCVGWVEFFTRPNNCERWVSHSPRRRA